MLRVERPWRSWIRLILWWGMDMDRWSVDLVMKKEREPLYTHIPNSII